MPSSERRKLIEERFAAVGHGAVIRPPFHVTTASTASQMERF
jgi:hypothetical protein